jgi:flagellar protein FlgJ
MAALGLPALPVDVGSLRRPEPALKPAEVKTREQAETVARDFERMFIAEMLQPMFAGIKTDGEFGGGAGEEAFRPLLLDRYAEQVAAGGGIGIADAVLKEILRMQGLE